MDFQDEENETTKKKRCYLREISPTIFDKSIKIWPFSD